MSTINKNWDEMLMITWTECSAAQKVNCFSLLKYVVFFQNHEHLLVAILYFQINIHGGGGI